MLDIGEPGVDPALEGGGYIGEPGVDPALEGGG